VDDPTPVHGLGAGQQLPHDAAHLGLRERPAAAVTHDCPEARPDVVHDDGVVRGAGLARDGAERDERGVTPAGRREAGLAQDVADVAPAAPAVEGLDGDGAARGAVARPDDDGAAPALLAEPAALLLVPAGAGHPTLPPERPRPPLGGGGGDVVDHRGDGGGSPGADRRPGGAVRMDHVADGREPGGDSVSHGGGNSLNFGGGGGHGDGEVLSCTVCQHSAIALANWMSRT
jgi:hypothetical protein